MNSRTLWASGVVAAGVLSGVVMFAASPGVPCIQGQICNLSALNVKNGITAGSISGGPVSGSGAPTATYLVDHALGSDSNSCTNSAAPCQTIQGACNKIPSKRIAGGINIIVDGGTYPEGGCFLEGFTFENSSNPSGGAYIRIAGVPIQSAASGLMSGTVASATALVNFVTLPTATVAGAGWTVNALKGAFFAITGGTGIGQTMAIASNTATVATMAGNWTNGVTPDGTSTFQIQDPCAVGGPVIDGGVPIPVNTQWVGTSPAAAYVGPSAFVLMNNGESATSPMLYEVPSSFSTGVRVVSGSIFIDNLCATPSNTNGFEFVSIRNSNGVSLRYNKLSALAPQTTAFISSDSQRTALLANYAVGSTSVEQGFFERPLQVGYSSVTWIGNVTDNLEWGGSYSGIGPFTPVGISQIKSFGNIINLGASNSFGIAAGACSGCAFDGDQISGAGTASAICMVFGCGWSGTGTCAGAASDIRIRGGSLNGCQGAGLVMSSGVVLNIAGNASQPTSGTAGVWGIKNLGGSLTIATNGGATVTGSSGNFTFDGTNAISYTTLNNNSNTTNLYNLARVQHGVGVNWNGGATVFGAVGAGVAFRNHTLDTCNAGIESAIERDATGGLSLGTPSKQCLCRSDGAAGYAWQNLVNGAIGTSTTCPATTVGMAGSLAGSWGAEDIGTAVAGGKFTGSFASSIAGTMDLISCSWQIAGAGTGNVVLHVQNDTDNTTLCTCTLGQCVTAANLSQNCSCNTAFLANKNYIVVMDGASNCAISYPQNTICSISLKQ